MATDAYYAWVNDGRPWKLAQPLKDIKSRMVAAGWPAEEIGTLGREDTHLQVDRPQDHAPFSTTGWPPAHPYPYVTAADYMHRPERGLDCVTLFAYRIAEARAGRTPWTKYLVWQARRYDVRNNWSPVAASGHFDHIHESIRTDWVDRTIGAWSPLGDDMSWDEKIGANYAPVGYGDHLFRTAVGYTWAAADNANKKLDTLTAHPPVDAAAVAAALAGDVAFREALADALAARLQPPSAEQVADAVADELHQRTGE